MIDKLKTLLLANPDKWGKSPCNCGHVCSSWFLNFTRSDGRMDEHEADLVIAMKEAMPVLLEVVEAARACVSTKAEKPGQALDNVNRLVALLEKLN